MYRGKQSGAVEACWAHNPEVGGSKPLSAMILYFIDLTAQSGAGVRQMVNPEE